MAAFLVMLREGVEAALIVAIVLTYMRRLGRTSETRPVWIGTGVAILLSGAAGAAIFNTVGRLEGRTEEITEGFIAFLAVAVLTWMIFWMARQARALRGQLQARVDTALSGGGGMALALIAFVAVLREGLESALFLISTTVGETASDGQLLGGVLGVAAAILIGYLFYEGGRRIDLRVFFKVTGILIILFAAGLAAKGVHEFQEVGWLPTSVEHVWSVGVFDPDTSLTGEFLKSLFGWDPDPSLEQVIAYFGYLIPVLMAFLRTGRPVPTEPAQPAAVTT